MDPDVREPLERRTEHQAPIEEELQPDPVSPSEDIAILHGLPHRRRMERADSDDLDVALPIPSRSLTYINGLALVIGLQIGSGIFSAPSAVSNHVTQPFAAILVWFLAGLLVWTGASSFVELGVRCPENGGIQEYLRHCFGDVYGFLFAWTWVLVVKPCSMAMISLIFAEYLYKIFSIGQDMSR